MGLDTLRENNAMVNTKYKTMDKKVNPVAGPQPTDTEKKRKEVLEDPWFRKSVDIEYTFTEESVEKLRIRGKEFLLPKEKNCFWKMLKAHEKGFAFPSNEIGHVSNVV